MRKRTRLRKFRPTRYMKITTVCTFALNGLNMLVEKLEKHKPEGERLVTLSIIYSMLQGHHEAFGSLLERLGEIIQDGSKK